MLILEILRKWESEEWGNHLYNHSKTFTFNSLLHFFLLSYCSNIVMSVMYDNISHFPIYFQLKCCPSYRLTLTHWILSTFHHQQPVLWFSRPAGCPAVQFSPDISYLELASGSMGWRTQPHKTAHTSDASHKDQGARTCDQLAINEGSYNPILVS